MIRRPGVRTPTVKHLNPTTRVGIGARHLLLMPRCLRLTSIATMAVMAATASWVAHATPLGPVHEQQLRERAASDARASAEFARQVLDVVNQYRAQQGLPTLQPDATLETIAAEHSRDMAGLGRLSHAGFSDRFERARSVLCVENLAANFARPENLVEGWRNSPSHHKNLLEPRVRQVGLASVNGFVTLFSCAPGGPQPTR